MIWDIIERMASDRLWIYTGIIGSILGAMSVGYLKTTRIGIWTYNKWDLLLDSIRDHFGWTWFHQDADAWRKINPHMSQKIDELESRIKKLEEK